MLVYLGSITFQLLRIQNLNDWLHIWSVRWLKILTWKQRGFLRHMTVCIWTAFTGTCLWSKVIILQGKILPTGIYISWYLFSTGSIWLLLMTSSSFFPKPTSLLSSCFLCFLCRKAFSAFLLTLLQNSSSFHFSVSNFSWPYNRTFVRSLGTFTLSRGLLALVFLALGSALYTIDTGPFFQSGYCFSTLE